MTEKVEIAMKALLVEIWTLKVILMRAQKEGNWRDSFHLLREYIHNPEQNIGRNMDIKHWTLAETLKVTLGRL